MIILITLKKKGKTIIFVSHDLEAIKVVAERCLYMKQGRLVFSGLTRDAIKMYMGSLYPKEKGLPSVKGTSNKKNKDLKADNYRGYLDLTHFIDGGNHPIGKGGAQLQKILISGCPRTLVFTGNERISLIGEIKLDTSIIKKLIKKYNLAENIIFGYSPGYTKINCTIFLKYFFVK